MADNTTGTSFQAAAYTAQGTARDKVALPETLFDGTVNMPVMHQAVKAYLANQRQGNASTKIRKYVTGGNQKPWKQKGTGRARVRLDPRAALGGRRHGVRTDSAQLRAVRAAPGPRAGPQERVQRARSRERDLRDRPVRLRRAEDVAPQGARRPARRRR